MQLDNGDDSPAWVYNPRRLSSSLPWTYKALEKTALFDLHTQEKGKVTKISYQFCFSSRVLSDSYTYIQMVPFAGYELPVLYETEWGGIVKGAYKG